MDLRISHETLLTEDSTTSPIATLVVKPPIHGHLGVKPHATCSITFLTPIVHHVYAEQFLGEQLEFIGFWIFFIVHPKGWQVSILCDTYASYIALQTWDSGAGNGLKMGHSLLSPPSKATWSPLQLLHHPHLWMPSTQILLKVYFSSLVLWKQLD